MKRLRSVAWPWYPLVLAASYVLGLWAGLDAALASLIRPLLLSVGVVGLGVAALSLMFGGHRAGMGAGGIVLLALAGSFERAVVVGLTVAFVLLLVVAVTRMHRRPAAADVTYVANRFSLLLLAAVVVTAIGTGAWGRAVAELTRHSTPPAATVRGPNFYVVLLDGYPRADTLTRIFDFDNRPFLGALGERGFDVSVHSRANYMHTSLTLASMFAMTHVEAAPSRTSLNANAVFERLRAQGYFLATVATPWEHVLLDSADEVCGSGQMTELEAHLLRTTLVGVGVELLKPTVHADARRQYVDTAFECLADVVDTPEPRLAFVHMPSPHWPIVFRRDGSPADLALFTGPQERPPVTAVRLAAYVEQVEYLNTRVLAAMDHVLEHDPDAVIVVLSDHGSEAGLDPASLAGTDLDERFSTLFAARTPGHDCLYGDAPTTVNTFSVMLSAYLGADVPLASDDLFASTVDAPNRVQRLPNPEPAGGSCR